MVNAITVVNSVTTTLTANIAMYDMVSSSLIHAIEHQFHDQKFTDDDVANHMDWAHDAEKWAEAQLAFGTATPFVQSILEGRKRYGSLTKGQYRGLMNMIRAEVLAADRTAEQLIAQIETGKEPLDLSKLPTGHYALMIDDNPVFYHVDNVEDGKWKGWVFANLQVSDDKRKLGMQRPNQKYQGQHEENLRKILADPLAASQLYGRTIGRCGVCGRTLTDPDSIELGIGPICAEQLGMKSSRGVRSDISKLMKILKQ